MKTMTIFECPFCMALYKSNETPKRVRCPDCLRAGQQKVNKGEVYVKRLKT